MSVSLSGGVNRIGEHTNDFSRGQEGSNVNIHQSPILK